MGYCYYCYYTVQDYRLQDYAGLGTHKGSETAPSTGHHDTTPPNKLTNKYCVLYCLFSCVIITSTTTNTYTPNRYKKKKDKRLHQMILSFWISPSRPGSRKSFQLWAKSTVATAHFTSLSTDKTINTLLTQNKPNDFFPTLDFTALLFFVFKKCAQTRIHK